MSDVTHAAALVGNFMHMHVPRLSAGNQALQCRSWSARLHVFRSGFTRSQHAEVAARFIDDAFVAVPAQERGARLEKASWYAIDGTLLPQPDTRRIEKLCTGIFRAIDPDMLSLEIVGQGVLPKNFQEAFQ